MSDLDLIKHLNTLACNSVMNEVPCDVLDTLSEAALRLTELVMWRPIESAPVEETNGPRIWVQLLTNGNEAGLGYRSPYHRGRWCMFTGTFIDFQNDKVFPVAWLPLAPAGLTYLNDKDLS